MLPLHSPTLNPIERRLVEQYVNVYCRETGHDDPRMAAAEMTPVELNPHIEAWRAVGLIPYRLDFTPTAYQLIGALTYFSLIGYHRMAPFGWIGRNGDWLPLTDATPLAELIADTLAAADHQLANDAASCRMHLKALMQNSMDKVRRFHRSARNQTHAPTFLAAEQGLRFGHVFHVTSKASEGFGEEDISRYAPELGTSFRLHYFAVATNLLETHTTDGECLPIDSQVHVSAGPDGAFGLLPCHPWQADYLRTQPQFETLLESGAVIALGPLGETAWPTSSVRTVWLPDQQLFLKLALNIRITNFVRNNPSEQVARALDASRALTLLPRHVIEQPAFRVLLELGSRTLKLPNEPLRAACAIVYRRAIPTQQTEHVRVMASVLEEPAEGEIPLLTLLRQAAGSRPLDEAVVRDWLARYLNVTLLPMLRLFSDYGVSLEAHLQNTLVAFQDGWPVCGYARDMEGTSISRTRFPFLDRLPFCSPALYTDEQAWHRFQYYVVVNQIGHLIACLARTGLVTEHALWCDTALRLGATGIALARQLCDQPTLPAKANMLSSFQQQGEHPVWVTIINPLVLARKDHAHF